MYSKVPSYLINSLVDLFLKVDMLWKNYSKPLNVIKTEFARNTKLIGAKNFSSLPNDPDFIPILTEEEDGLRIKDGMSYETYLKKKAYFEKLCLDDHLMPLLEKTKYIERCRRNQSWIYDDDLIDCCACLEWIPRLFETKSIRDERNKYFLTPSPPCGPVVLGHDGEEIVNSNNSEEEGC